jgi:hypothetical protein
MGFEQIGRWALKPLGSLFSLFLCSIPLCTAYFIHSKHVLLERIEEQFFTARKRGKAAFERKEREEKFLAHHAHSDSYFLDKEIESLQFLEKETSLLNQWASHPAMHFYNPLNLSENRLIFSEEKTQTSPLCKETIEIQRHPIKINETDLKKLLSLIEEIPSNLTGRPQLLITDFHLVPKEGLLEIQMNLLKREFL